MNKIKTSAVEMYLNSESNTGSGAKKYGWIRVRKQHNLSMKYNAETTEDKWIDESSPSTSVDRYTTSSDGELICHEGDPLFKYLDNMRFKRAVGGECESDVLVIYKYRKVDMDRNSYYAERSRCSIQFSEFSGEGGGGTLSIQYSVNMNGDPDIGKVTLGDGTLSFVADSTLGQTWTEGFTTAGVPGGETVIPGEDTDDTETNE